MDAIPLNGDNIAVLLPGSKPELETEAIAARAEHYIVRLSALRARMFGLEANLQQQQEQNNQ